MLGSPQTKPGEGREMVFPLCRQQCLRRGSRRITAESRTSTEIRTKDRTKFGCVLVLLVVHERLELTGELGALVSSDCRGQNPLGGMGFSLQRCRVLPGLPTGLEAATPLLQGLHCSEPLGLHCPGGHFLNGCVKRSPKSLSPQFSTNSWSGQGGGPKRCKQLLQHLLSGFQYSRRPQNWEASGCGKA